MFAGGNSCTMGAEMRKWLQSRQMMPHENRDAVAAAFFVPAAIIVAINIELGRLQIGFWIASAVAATAWLCSYHKLLPLAALFGFVALRMGVASVAEHKPMYLLIALACGALGILLVKHQRQ